MADDFEPITFKAYDLAGRGIAQQHHLANPKIEQDLSADAVFDEPLLAALLGLLFTRETGGDGVWAFAYQHDHAAALAADDVHGLVHQSLAMAARAENIVERVGGMY